MRMYFLMGASSAAGIPTPTFPSGWTTIGGPTTVSENNNPLTFSVRSWTLRKRASSEGTTYTVTHSAASSDCLIATVESALDDAGSISTNDGDGNGDITFLSVTTDAADANILAFCHNWALWGAGTAPAGTTPTFTERQDSASSLIHFSEGTWSGSGATGNKTKDSDNTGAGGAQWAAMLVAVENASGATNFDATGALAAQASAIAGSAVVGRTSTGALTAQASTVAGSATHGRVSTGALTAQTAAIAGAATVGRTSTGALTAQVSSISGAAVVGRTASGALTAQSSAVAGAATVGRVATGSLQAQDATIAGEATVDGATLNATGDLQAQSASIDGAAVVGRTSSGSLQAQSASISGTVTINRTASGALQAQLATISGSADTSAVSADLPVTPAGAPVRDTRHQRRRRYIMPDGSVYYATTQEAYEILRRYAVPAEPEPAAKGDKRQRIVMPRIELEKRDVRFMPAADSLQGTYKAVINERFVYQPPPEAALQAQNVLNRMRSEEEALIVLLM
jgi:hypothetical protein